MIIINGYIHTMAGDTIERGYIKIEGKKIAGVGRMKELEDTDFKSEKVNSGQKTGNCKSEEILDVKGAWVMPGIIEAHCHVGITEEKTELQEMTATR